MNFLALSGKGSLNVKGKESLIPFIPFFLLFPHFPHPAPTPHPPPCPLNPFPPRPLPLRCSLLLSLFFLPPIPGVLSPFLSPQPFSFSLSPAPFFSFPLLHPCPFSLSPPAPLRPSPGQAGPGPWRGLLRCLGVIACPWTTSAGSGISPSAAWGAGPACSVGPCAAGAGAGRGLGLGLTTARQPEEQLVPLGRSGMRLPRRCQPSPGRAAAAFCHPAGAVTRKPEDAAFLLPRVVVARGRVRPLLGVSSSGLRG